MKRPRKQKATRRLTFATVRAIAARLPGAEEGTSYGTPAFRVGGRLFARQHQDGESLIVRLEPAERTMRMQADPETFFLTDHYVGTPWLLVRLATVARDDLKDLLEESWRQSAPKHLHPARAGKQGRISRIKPQDEIKRT